MKYSALCALAWRQTLAALKPVWVDDRQAGWTFLKEISRDAMGVTTDKVDTGYRRKVKFGVSRGVKINPKMTN